MIERLPSDIERKLGMIKAYDIGVIAEKRGSEWYIFIGSDATSWSDTGMLALYLDEVLRKLR